MPVSAETLRLLMDAGVEGAELLRIVDSIEADNQPKARSANAIRQARFRVNKRMAGVTNNVPSNATDNMPSDVTPVTESRVRVEDNLQTKKPTGQRKNKQTREQDLADFVSVLSAFLDAERVQALVDVRSTKGGKLNGHAATLLKAKIETCGLSPQEAADTMALRNWISIEASWIQRQQSPPGHKRNFADVAMDRVKANGSESIFGGDGDAQRLPARIGEPGPDDGDIRGGIARRFGAGGH